MYLVANNFLDSTHGALGCITCHDGQNVSDKEGAHQGLIVRPSADTDGICAQCHGSITTSFSNSLHSTLHGFVSSLETFSEPGVLEQEGGLQYLYENNCSSCHASCGSCHVSRPVSYTGGLHSQHEFTKTPPMEETCYGCHPTRNGGEFMGKVGYTPDVHYQAGMECVDCHDVSNFHGSGEQEMGMYQLNSMVQCTDCHQDVYSGTSPIEAHKVHNEDLMSCQVCHASANNNCFDCHVTLKDDGGLSSTSETKLMFKIGTNPEITERYPYKYVTLRHVPTTIDSFIQLGESLLPNYHSVSNWKMSPTHNIQRVTLQNETCSSCHGNQYIFLQEKDLRDTDSAANERVLVKEIP